MRTVAPRLPLGQEITVAEEQLEYLPCVATRLQYADGTWGWLLRWTFTEEERAKVAAGADVYVSMLTRHVVPHNLELRPAWAGEEQS